ncbi:hypothetical protein WA556_006888, partial [Blastocystis sp. ATCC 50177/Nand II]
MDLSINDLSDSVSFVIDVGGVLGSIDGDGKKIIDRLLLIILKMLTSSQQTRSSYYWNYRFFDSRYVFGKTPNELNKYISLLKKNNYTSISSCDYSYEIINRGTFQKFVEQLYALLDILSLGKKLQKSATLTQAVEEQRKRVKKMKEENDPAQEQQLRNEESLLEERLLILNGSPNPKRTPLLVWIDTLEEIQRSFSANSLSDSNVVFIGDLSYVLEIREDMISPRFLQLSQEEDPASADIEFQRTLTVVDMSVTPPAPREFQRKFDASWRELYPEQAHQVR